MKEYIGEILTAVVAFALSWIAKGKIIKAEGNTAEANALEAMQKAYDMYIEHNNAKMIVLEKEIKELRVSFDKEKKYWKNKYKMVLKEFETYKKDNAK